MATGIARVHFVPIAYLISVFEFVAQKHFSRVSPSGEIDQPAFEILNDNALAADPGDKLL